MHKIAIESEEHRIESERLQRTVNEIEAETSNIINRAIKEGHSMNRASSPRKSRNQDRRHPQNADREAQMQYEMSKNNIRKQKIEAKMKAIKDSRNDRLYEDKLKLEQAGREETEEKARELLLMSTGGHDGSVAYLKREVVNLRMEYENTKREWVNTGCDPSPGLTILRDLEKQLFELKKFRKQ